MANNGIATTHPEYDRMVDKWNRVDDVVNSECEKYLYKVGSCEANPEVGIKRQSEYEDGAILTNFTLNTRNGMQGMIFIKDPIIKLPTQLQYLLNDCDGNGLTLRQSAMVSVDEDLRKGRGGLLVDFPTVEEVPTLQQIANGETVPRIQNYTAQSIVNWRTRRIGSINKLAMIVLRENVDLSATDHLTQTYYENVNNYQYRALMLDADGYYLQRVYKPSEKGQFEYVKDIYPRQNGQLMRHIPFFFYGSENNDYTVDAAPLLSIANLNIGHYRNSADNEEAIHIACQPMLVISPSEQFGSAEQWNEANPNGVKIGSRSGLNVGSGGDAKFIQAEATNAASNGMIEKEEKAKLIGATMISESANVTAETARIQQGANGSVLANIAINVTAAYRLAIAECARFLGLKNPEFEFTLNKDFYFSKLSAQDKAQWMSEIMTGVTPKTLYYKALRNSGDIPDDWTDKDIQSALELDGRGDNSEGLV